MTRHLPATIRRARATLAAARAEVFGIDLGTYVRYLGRNGTVVQLSQNDALVVWSDGREDRWIAYRLLTPIPR